MPESDARSVTFLQTLPELVTFSSLVAIFFWFANGPEGAFFFSAKLSTDDVSALRKVWVLIRRWKQHNVQQSPGEIKRREVSWTLMKKLDAFAGPGEIKRREVVLDPQVNPEEIKNREVELS